MSKALSFMTLVLVVAMTLTGCQKKEEAEEAPEMATLTNEQVVQAIEDYIAGNLSADSTFAVEDALEKRSRNLKLDHVHTTVHHTDDGKYYACADMTEGAQKLDLDFYVVAEDGKPEVTEVVIHKVDDIVRK